MLLVCGTLNLFHILEGRGIMKKVLMPFLLGLKLKTTVLVPIALALIALKTWKAMTLGLLSLVLSGALVIFKIIKPKVRNYIIYSFGEFRLIIFLRRLSIMKSCTIPQLIT